MILVGRNLSPFVRRTAIVLRTLGLPYEENPLSTADDLAEITKNNPVGRVPALVLDDGEVLVDSAAIIDHLIEAHDSGRVLLPAAGAPRRAVLRTTAVATGVMEKGVSSSYERNRRPADKVYQNWVDRVDSQAATGLVELDRLAAASGGWLHGGDMTLADISAVCAHDFIAAMVPYLLERASHPALAALADKANALPAFKETHPTA